MEQSLLHNDKFWSQNPSILLNRLTEFYPHQEMSDDEKLNSIARFTIYLGIILFLFYSNINFLFIPLAGLGITYLIHSSTPIVEKFNNDSLKLDHTDYHDQSCQVPTQNNPFMNILPADYHNQPNRPPACLHSDLDIYKQVKTHFNHNLYQDVEDIWDKRNSQREFITMPITTIPNDRESFMKWCWETTNTSQINDFQ